MKNLIVLVCAASLLGTAVNAAIIADGDFELGAGWPFGWLYGGSAGRVAGVGVGGSYGGQTWADASHIHGLLNVTEAGGSWDPLQEYVCTFDAKNSDGLTNVELGLLGPGFADWEVFALTTVWQTFTGSVYFPFGAINADVFFYQRGTGSVQVDNVSFAEAVPEPATLLLLSLGGLLIRRRK